MKVDINKTVYELVKDNNNLKEALLNLGFKGIDNPLMLNTMGKKTSLKRGAKLMGIKDLSEGLRKQGYEVVDSSNSDEVLQRKALIKSYLERLNSGEDLESVREDFKKNFENVSSAEIMDAEEELLENGMDKERVRQLCDVHSSLFHGMDKEEKTDDTYEDYPFLAYFFKENRKIKALIEDTLKDKSENIEDILSKISKHYKKKGDLIYPILKVKYNKPGPSDVMWAVDIEIVNNIKKSIKLDNKELLLESLKRAEEMTFKEENILYPLIFDNFTDEDFKLLYEDLADYDHDLVTYRSLEDIELSKNKQENYINFKKGKMRLDQLEAMLDTLKIEITYIDENDINSYYNDNEAKKIFKRPQSSLGRQVYTCHPPQVEDLVRNLIKDFKEGRKDCLELVRKIGEKDVAIGYYAVRDKKGIYKGVVETVEDISAYRKYFLGNK